MYWMELDDLDWFVIHMEGCEHLPDNLSAEVGDGYGLYGPYANVGEAYVAYVVPSAVTVQGTEECGCCIPPFDPCDEHRFTKRPRAHYQESSAERLACGGYERLNDRLNRVTSDPHNVTCEKCKGTSKFRRALQEMGK